MKKKKKEVALHVMKKDEPIQPVGIEPSEITKDTFPHENKVHVLFGLPEYLKDRENYPKIQKALLETLASKHSHGEMSEWYNCVSCQLKMHEHAEMIRGLGFSSPAQYRAWCKVHETIKKRVPLR
jgi:hypothetical protein